MADFRLYFSARCKESFFFLPDWVGYPKDSRRGVISHVCTCKRCVMSKVLSIMHRVDFSISKIMAFIDQQEEEYFSTLKVKCMIVNH